MKRRTVLKQLGMLAGAIVLLPHCTGKESAGTLTPVTLHTLKPTPDHQESLAALVDALIPKTELPGARELNIHNFVWRMVDDCTAEEDQKKFMTGLDQLSTICEGRFGNAISECSAEELKTLLTELNEGKISAKDGEDHIGDFYKRFRGLTIRGFAGSEPIMVDVYGYKMIPGHFKGVVEIKDPNDIKTLLG